MVQEPGQCTAGVGSSSPNHQGLHHHLRWLGIHLLREGAFWLLHRLRTVGLLGHHLLLRLWTGKGEAEELLNGQRKTGGCTRTHARVSLLYG